MYALFATGSKHKKKKKRKSLQKLRHIKARIGQLWHETP